MPAPNAASPLDPVRRALIVRPSHLGDIVCTLPLFHALRAALPDARIGWVVQREFAGLLHDLPGLDEVFLFDRRRGPAAWWSLRAELRRFAADLAVDAQGNAKSGMATLCSRARHRIGLARADWREPIGAYALTEEAPPSPADEPHAVQRVVRLTEHVLDRLQETSGDALRRTDAALTPAELARGEALADRWLPGGHGAPTIVQVAAPNDVRSWPTDHYRRLAEALLARGRAVLLLSGPGERPIGVALRESLRTRPGLRHWIGQDNLREACAFFAAAAGRGARLVTGDSGPMHLAAASGLPVVALAGPQDAARTGPWGDGHVVLRASDSPDCAPCLARRCTHAKGPVCMERIVPEDVVSALESPRRASA